MKRRIPQRDKPERVAPPELGIALLLGDPVELPLLTALGVCAESLDALFDGGWLIPISGREASIGPEVDRETVLGQMAWSEKRRLHERTAQLLAKQPDRFTDAARHFIAACKYPEARRLLVRIAEAACHEKRYEDALQALDEGLRIWPAEEDRQDRLRVVREMVRCARNSDHLDVAARGLREILEMAGDDPALGMEAHQQLADLARQSLDAAGTRRDLEAAAQLAELHASKEDAARRWYAVASFLTDQVRPAEARTALDRALKLISTRSDPSLRSELLGFDGLLHAMRGDGKTARARVDEALKIAAKHQLSAALAEAYRRQANVREYCSDYRGERDAHMHALSLCRNQSQQDSARACYVCLSYVFFRLGDWKRAIEITRDVEADQGAHPAQQIAARGIRALVGAFRGEQRHIVEQLEATDEALRRFGVVTLTFHFLWGCGYVHQSAGNVEAASATYARLLDTWNETEDVHDVVPGAATAAAFFAEQGDSRRVAQATDILRAVVAANDNLESRAGRHSVRASSAIVAQDWAAAARELQSATAAYDQVCTPVERALEHLRLTKVLTRMGKEREAATERAACAALAKQYGLRPVLAALAGTSEPVATPAASAEALTGRQRDVLRLLADGLTNKEAADRLKLSPRTVEMHVASLLNRLNCRTRSEAIRRATERGWIG